MSVLEGKVQAMSKSNLARFSDVIRRLCLMDSDEDVKYSVLCFCCILYCTTGRGKNRGLESSSLEWERTEFSLADQMMYLWNNMKEELL